jgi:hypothetical protein
MNHRADRASERQEKVEIKPNLLAQLEAKAHQKGLSLFAYLAHFVTQDSRETQRRDSRPRFDERMSID